MPAPVVTLLGTASANDATTVSTITTAVAVPAGSLVVLLHTPSVSLPPVTDSVGNTYTPEVLGTTRGMGYWCRRCLAMPAGTVITVNYGAYPLNPRVMAAYAVTNVLEDIIESVRSHVRDPVFPATVHNFTQQDGIPTPNGRKWAAIACWEWDPTAAALAGQSVTGELTFNGSGTAGVYGMAYASGDGDNAGSPVGILSPSTGAWATDEDFQITLSASTYADGVAFVWWERHPASAGHAIHPLTKQRLVARLSGDNLVVDVTDAPESGTVVRSVTVDATRPCRVPRIIIGSDGIADLIYTGVDRTYSISDPTVIENESKTIYLAESEDIGRTWILRGAIYGLAGMQGELATYAIGEALDGRRLFVIAVYSEYSGEWQITVGYRGSSGDGITFSSPLTVATAARPVQGELRQDTDTGAWELLYLPQAAGSNWSIVRCYDLSADGTGTWS